MCSQVLAAVPPWPLPPLPTDSHNHVPLWASKTICQEMLCSFLVALRLWFPLWRGRRAAVAVRSDSQAALGALGKLGSPAPAVGRVAREVALDVALSCYGVDVWQHLPADQNKEADALSRWAEPGAEQCVPPRLAQARHDIPEVRNDSWWLASSSEWQSRLRSVRA